MREGDWRRICGVHDLDFGQEGGGGDRQDSTCCGGNGMLFHRRNETIAMAIEGLDDLVRLPCIPDGFTEGRNAPGERGLTDTLARPEEGT